MDPSILDKYKDNIVAFFAGSITFCIATWLVADNFRTREVAVLEREKAELQRRISDADMALKQCGAVAEASSARSNRLSSLGRIQLETLINTIDFEINSKKEQLAGNSSITVGGPQPESYGRIEAELKSLQEQRDQARRRLINAAGE